MTGRRDVYDQAMKQGHSAAWDQQWDRAIAAYTAAAQEFPEDANALTSLGFAYLQLDRLDEALGIYQRAATLSPGDPLAPEKCGEILERLGRVTEASQTYMVVAEIHLSRRDVNKAMSNWERVTHLTPDNLMAHSRLALACERSGQTKQAVLEYIEVARIFQRARDIDKANQALNRATQLDPQSPEARDALDKLRRGQPLPIPERPRTLTGTLKPFGASDFGSPPEPEPVHTHEKRSSPMDAAQEKATELLADMLFDTDTDTSRTAGSISALTKGTGFLKGDPNRRAQAIQHLGQALGAQSSGDAKGAIGQYENALNIGFESAVVNFLLGKLYLEGNRAADAAKRFSQAVNHEDVGVGAMFGLGQAYYKQNKIKEAFQNLFVVLKRYDQELVKPEQQDFLAEAYESVLEGLGQVAETDLKRVVGSLLDFLSGDGWEDRLRQARQQLDAATEEGQVQPLADLLAVPGAEHLVDSMRLIESCIAHQMWETALEESLFALVHSPTHLPVHIRMAEILVAQNKVQAAVDKYAVVAETYRIRGELGRAARLMQQVLKYNPLDVSLRTKLIEMLVEQGKTGDALNQFMDLADTYYQLADLTAAYNTYADALILARQSNNKRSQVQFLHKMGDIELQRLNWREGQQIYEQIKTLAPDDEIARVTLIDLLSRLGNERQAVAELDSYLHQLLTTRQGSKAVQMLEDLLQSDPASLVYIERLAKVNQDLGRKDEAIQQYEKLADAQLDAGHKPQAIQSIKAILALGPANPQDYQQLLQQIAA